jgi:RNA-binding protein 39
MVYFFFFEKEDLGPNSYERFIRRSKSRNQTKTTRDQNKHRKTQDRRITLRSDSTTPAITSNSRGQNCRDNRDRDSKRPHSSPRREDIDRTRNEKFREMRELDRATRTVFLSNLHIKVNEKDLFILFTQKAGKVTDIYIICDRQANKSKGLAYIELETIESMARALGLSGIELYGQPIQVKPSEMEKNVQWTLQKQAQQGILASSSAPTTTTAPLPIPGVDIAAAAVEAAKLLSTNGCNPLFNCSIDSQEDQRQRKIYIGNLPREINELVLRNMFEPFGTVESSNVIKDSTGKPHGYGFILFREREVVEKAIQAMNGILIGSNIIKVNYVTSGGIVQAANQPLSSNELLQKPITTTTGVDLDRIDDEGGLKINSQNRMLLMHKLASSANINLPLAEMPATLVQLPGQIPTTVPETHPLKSLQGLLGPSSPVPTNCLLLKNMFDETDMNPNEDWEFEIYEDVKDEASKTGSVQHIFVDKNSKGFVYIKMGTVESAVQTFNMLNGRIYGGRQILVAYQVKHIYEHIFRQ